MIFLHVSLLNLTVFISWCDSFHYIHNLLKNYLVDLNLDLAFIIIL